MLDGEKNVLKYLKRKWKVGEQFRTVSWWTKSKLWVLKKTFQGFCAFVVHKTGF